MATRCLVIGASGYIGGHLVPYLVAQGLEVVAAARHVGKVPAGAKGVYADCLQPDSLKQALVGIDVAYYLVHSMGDGADSQRLEWQGAKNFAQAAKAAGLKRLIFLGAIQPEANPSKHLLTRQRCGDIFRAAGVPTIELRAGIIIGAGSAAFEVMRDLVFNLPVLLTPAWVRSRMAPIALPNILYYLHQLHHLPDIEGQIFNAVGEDVLSYEDQLRHMAAHIQKKRWIIPLPWLSPELSAHWLVLVTSVPTDIAKALVGGLKSDILPDPTPLRALIPQALIAYPDAVRLAFTEEQAQGALQQGQETALGLRYRHPEYGFYDRIAEGKGLSLASPERLWEVLTQGLGGEKGYFAHTYLWRIREYLDACIGGPGLQRSRPAGDFAVGDYIDSWEILGVTQARRLNLRFNMKAPGVGRLEFILTPQASGLTALTITAHWHPQGIWGLLYWFAMLPFHLFIFKAMVHAIIQQAESTDPLCSPSKA